MNSSETIKLPVQTIAELLASGKTVSQVARDFGTDYFTVYRLVRAYQIDIPSRRGRRIPSEKRKEILRLLLKTNLSVMAIMKRLELGSRSTIYVIKHRLTRRAERAAEKNGLSFRSIENDQRKCTVHGLVSVWPCVACAAEKRQKQRLRST